MSAVGLRFNVVNIVLALLCLSNLLELFVPRMDTDNYFVRLPIQALSGLVLVLMWNFLINNKNRWNSLTKSILLLLLLVMMHTLVYFISGNFVLNRFSPYIKLLLWLSSAIFFYEASFHYKAAPTLLRLYILTFIIAMGKAIVETSIFSHARITGGDTASLPLLFILPLILLFFNKNLKFILLGVVGVLVLFSLRRTAILGLAICVPFFYRDMKSSLKKHHIFLIVVLLIAGIMYSWQFVGEIIVSRFGELFTGDGGGEKESFGSGRSNFYVIVWENWWEGSTFNIFFGNGLGSVYKMLMKEYNLGHAHNDFLEIGYTFGLLGIALWFNFLRKLWNWRKALQMNSPKIINLFFIVFISYVIIGLASGSILKSSTFPLGISIGYISFLPYFERYHRVSSLNKRKILTQE